MASIRIPSAAAWLLVPALVACGGQRGDGEPQRTLDVFDASPSDDVDAMDAADTDAGTVDTDPADAEADDATPNGACDWMEPIDDTQPRPVLVSHPFTEDVEVRGTTVRLLQLRPDRSLVDTLATLDVGFRASRIEFAPSGELALVLGENGELASLSVGDEAFVLDSVTLPSAAYGDLRFVAEEATAFVVGTNSVDTGDSRGGISTVRVACDGTLAVDDAAFFPLRLAESMAFVGSDRAVVLGGQTVFEPVDPNDVRLLEWDKAGWVEIGAFDIFSDFVSAGGIAAASDEFVLIPNASIASTESSQVRQVLVVGDVIEEFARIEGLVDPSEIVVASDGATALVSLVQENEVVVLERAFDGRFMELERIGGIGLPDQMAHVESGPAAGTVLIPSVDVNGTSNIALLHFEAPGVVRDLGQRDLGGGLSAIPGAIGVPR
jgi:hypothetical protein